MAKDFMMDVTPDSHGDAGEESVAAPREVRGIRNITLDERKLPRMDGMRPQEERPPVTPRVVVPAKARSKLLLWGAVALSLVLVTGTAAVAFMGETRITVTPRAHTITFDPAIELTAFPETDAATGSLTYSIHSTVIDESMVVEARGVEKVQEKASGSLTVYNEFSATPVKLIKNTRFQSSNGLIYRIPASIEVPGKKGSTPGQLQVTVFADTTGPEYNIAPGKFTVPGLKGTPDMFSGVYGRSENAFSGGFVGDRPAVDPKALAANKATLQAKLKERASASVQVEGSFVLSELTSVSFESLPAVSEPGGGVKITERATIRVPLFDGVQFAQSVAKSVAADAENYEIRITPNSDFKIVADAKKGTVGKPIPFSLSGGALLSWVVDPQKVAQSLAGKNGGAFQTIVGGFSSIDHAKADIAPFWRNTFPEDPLKIAVTIEGSRDSQ